jgi:hypothetical protein
VLDLKVTTAACWESAASIWAQPASSSTLTPRPAAAARGASQERLRR